MRTDFLVHWTGKDICLDSQALSDEHRARYVDRLADILGKGFWMTKPDEKIYGNKNVYIEYSAPMTCFTEIRLSQAKLHAQRYGLLGVGVTRRFVLDRLGGPVHYVRNHPTAYAPGMCAVLEQRSGAGHSLKPTRHGIERFMATS